MLLFLLLVLLLFLRHILLFPRSFYSKDIGHASPDQSPLWPLESLLWDPETSQNPVKQYSQSVRGSHSHLIGFSSGRLN